MTFAAFGVTVGVDFFGVASSVLISSLTSFSSVLVVVDDGGVVVGGCGGSGSVSVVSFTVTCDVVVGDVVVGGGDAFVSSCLTSSFCFSSFLCSPFGIGGGGGGGCFGFINGETNAVIFFWNGETSLLFKSFVLPVLFTAESIFAMNGFFVTLPSAPTLRFKSNFEKIFEPECVFLLVF